MKKILIVEDHDDAMQQMARVVCLAYEDPTVISAATIEQGLREAKKHFFDLAPMFRAVYTRSL